MSSSHEMAALAQSGVDTKPVKCRFFNFIMPLDVEDRYVPVETVGD